MEKQNTESAFFKKILRVLMVERTLEEPGGLQKEVTERERRPNLHFFSYFKMFSVRSVVKA